MRAKSITFGMAVAVRAIFVSATAALAGTVTLSERDTGTAIQLITIDDQTNEVSIFEDGKLIEVRPGTEREIAAIQRIVKAEDRQTKLDELQASVDDLKGRPVVVVNDRIARLETLVLELAAQLGIE